MKSFIQQDAECDFMTEELCIDENDNLFCAPLETGCPCNAGEVKCGAIEGLWAGYCTTLCCKANEETCYDDTFNPTKCEAVSTGGCPCPDGQTKCGGIIEANYPGFCMDVCCDEDEDWCFDEVGNLSCAAMAEGGCPKSSGMKSQMLTADGSLM